MFFSEYVAKQGKYKDFTVDLKPYAKNPELKKRFIERMKKDSFAAPDNYYHSLKDNHNLDDERKLSTKDKEITVPLLYIGQTGDWVCRTDLMSDAKEAGLIKNELEEKVVQAGHWFLYEVSPSTTKNQISLTCCVGSGGVRGSGHRLAGEEVPSGIMRSLVAVCGRGRSSCGSLSILNSAGGEYVSGFCPKWLPSGHNPVRKIVFTFSAT